jgi:hypothetical protein
VDGRRRHNDLTERVVGVAVRGARAEDRRGERDQDERWVSTRRLPVLRPPRMGGDE